MTRIGVISDIHGNLPALEAVLAELEREQLDGLVCLGDVAVGPQPAETLARVRALGCPVVEGNWDEWFHRGIPCADPADEVAGRLAEIAEWWAAQLSAGELESLGGFQQTLELDLGDGETAFCFHGSPTSNTDGIYAVTPDESLAAMLRDAGPRIFLCGHTHVQLLRRHEDGLVVNPGSVGLPFCDWTPPSIRVAPWAEYAIVGHDDGRLRLDLRRTTYDVDAFLEAVLGSGMPHARWWVETWERSDRSG